MAPKVEGALADRGTANKWVCPRENILACIPLHTHAHTCLHVQHVYFKHKIGNSHCGSVG